MNLLEIRRMPTDTSELELDDTSKVHESCLQSYHILEKVMDFIEKDTPKEVIKEIVELLRSPISNKD